MPIRTLLTDAPIGQEVTVQGWVRTSRFSKRVTFVEESKAVLGGTGQHQGRPVPL